jgi:hypothetical protein
VFQIFAGTENSGTEETNVYTEKAFQWFVQQAQAFG